MNIKTIEIKYVIPSIRKISLISQRCNVNGKLIFIPRRSIGPAVVPCRRTAARAPANIVVVCP